MIASIAKPPTYTPRASGFQPLAYLAEVVMHLKRLCFCSLAVLAFACAAFGLEARHEVYVIETKPPSVVIVDTAQGTIVGRIPIRKNPDEALVGSHGRFLYVVQNHRGLMGIEYSKPSNLSVVDLKNRRVDRVIQLKTGVNRMQLSSDGRTLFCFADGNIMKSHPKPRDDASITSIDTASQQVKKVYRISTPAGYLAMTRDGSRIFAFTGGVFRGMTLGGSIKLKYSASQMTVFTKAQGQPLATVDLHRFYPTSGAFSLNEKLLFLLGERHACKGKLLQKGGTLDVVDAETGKVVHAYTVGPDPLRLVRLGQQPGLWIVGKEEIQFISDQGALSSQGIFLNGKGPSRSPKLDGYPGDILLLPGDEMAVLITKKDGATEHRLALLDVKEQKVEKVVPVGRKGTRVGKKLGRFGLDLGLSLASAGAFNAAGSPYFPLFVPGLGLSGGMGLARRADGKYFYALDAASHDVTVVRSADGEIAGQIPVSSSSLLLWIPKGSHYLICFGGGTTYVINTDTNKPTAERKISGSFFRDVEANPKTLRLYLLTDRELQVWDGSDGKEVKSIPGFKHALLLVRGDGLAL